MVDLLCLFTGTAPSGLWLTGNDTEIGSIWDLSILMRCRCMRIFLWWLLCDGIICGPLHAVDGSPLYEDPTEVWSVDQPCALDMCNTARSFTHKSNTYLIRKWTFLILGFIDLLSYIPPPTTLLLTIFGWGEGSWHRPRTHVRLKSERWSDSFSALLSVCAQRQACATIPQLTLLFTILNCSLYFRRFSVCVYVALFCGPYIGEITAPWCHPQ